MFVKFVKKEFVMMLVLFFSFVIVSADFGDINVDDGDIPTEEVEIVSEEEVVISTSTVQTSGSRDKGVAETRYNLYFYVAIGLGFVVFLLVIYFLYRLAAGPSVRWNNPKPIKH